MMKPKAGMGRPSKFGDLNMRYVMKLAIKGWTDEEMADFFEVDRATWYRWKKKHHDFCDALKDWKAKADARVERALFERATGYSHPETKFATRQGQITDRAEYMKHYPPDTTACIFWLKNRQPDKWRDKQVVDMAVLDPAERLKRAKARLDKVKGA